MAVQDNDKSSIYKSVFDAIPSMIFIVDQDVKIHEYNTAAARLLQEERNSVLMRRCGDAFHCLHSNDVAKGCGHSPICRDCIIRNAVAKAFQGHSVIRRRTRLQILCEQKKEEIYALITASPFQCNEKPLVLLVIEDIREIAELQRLIPICSVCKVVRDETATWSRLETYFKKQWDVDFSHGLCPVCYQKQMEQITGGVSDPADESSQ